jgi:hypothetical protein
MLQWSSPPRARAVVSGRCGRGMRCARGATGGGAGMCWSCPKRPTRDNPRRRAHALCALPCTACPPAAPPRVLAAAGAFCERTSAARPFGGTAQRHARVCPVRGEPSLALPCARQCVRRCRSASVPRSARRPPPPLAQAAHTVLHALTRLRRRVGGRLRPHRRARPHRPVPTPHRRVERRCGRCRCACAHSHRVHARM